MSFLPTLSTQLTSGAALPPGKDDTGGKEPALAPVPGTGEPLPLDRFACFESHPLACLGAWTGAHLMVAEGGRVCDEPKGMPEWGVMGDEEQVVDGEPDRDSPVHESGRRRTVESLRLWAIVLVKTGLEAFPTSIGSSSAITPPTEDIEDWEKWVNEEEVKFVETEEWDP